ncbi:MAG: sigma-54-dependent Fis family transcriptional regulator [Desulfobacula sp.]|jgi:two-component system, NtrC family, response regulator HydG|uniref:sigma-54-dependent transcriptional regulator n=1 Tax=Desulfobacula sp. TaxID=2593537 RepID=UPI001E00C194|nr:sigma-54-dependent Fis family transcriptional regulator [Desulfobacula sp.]MBT3804533.1 sigma-54-dependent Fis family transcriptional regulator [Desulfobacula sp.]MBT4025808.1 sigma-54-dependent Fis family transcriptional regulator [Desulfobacula sp.]MBT4199222.1 sigma-54-dependent Fis family transcriptional regulator [Desulfobacula sp.]MBT4506462.1 sigma-54-dependent Fis family transcriptional regulator [Desulfobacula sp.]
MAGQSCKESILIVDDNAITCEVVQRNLELEGYHIFTALSVEDATKTLSKQRIDLLITDYKMPRLTGLDLIRYVRDHFQDIGIIMLTGYGSINSAVSAMKEGADEYITKPFTDKELLSAVKKNILQQKEKKIDLDKFYNDSWNQFGIIGQSQNMLATYSKIEKASKNDAIVLISGENGTGKELVARAIHYNHKVRSIYPFIPVNCPGIPASLFESELFGHVKGAFTGAVQHRTGFFQAAQKGCLFLDEISELPFELQAKLLRVLQEKEICRVGETQAKKIDARIIAATNKNLAELVEKGLFRQDLFFRLNVITIEIPPLRDREDDIILLAKHFVLKYAEELEKTPPVFTDKAIAALKKYYWPGNVRELENLIHRNLIMNDKNKIDSLNFPDMMKFNIEYDQDLNLSLEEMSKKYVKDVVEQTKGNKAKAIEILKIDRKTLLKKLK